MPPARESRPAMFVDVPQRFGRRDGAAYPLRAADAPALTAAAWAQHQLVQGLRVWVVEAGFDTPTAWIGEDGLSRTTWGRIIRGEQWVTLENLAFLAGRFGEAAQRQVEDLAASLNGRNLPEVPAAALAGRRVSRPVRSTLKSRQERIRNGMGKDLGPKDAEDSVWVALMTLAEQANVDPPESILVYEGEEVGLWSEPGWEGSVTLLDRKAPPLPVVDGYLVLSGQARPQTDVVVADYVADSIDGPGFTSREAVITRGNTVKFEQ